MKNKAFMKKILLSFWMLAGILFFSGFSGENRKVMDYLSVTFSGIDTQGELTLHFDRDRLKAEIYDRMEMTERQKLTLDQLLSDVELDFILSGKTGLTNGDEIKIKSGFDENLLSDYGIVFENGTLTVTVEGLMEPKKINLGDAVKITLTGICPSVTVHREVDETVPYYQWTSLPNLPREESIVAEPGETRRESITYDEEKMFAQGYVVVNDSYEYTVSGLDTYQLSIEEAEDPRLDELYEKTDETFMAESKLSVKPYIRDSSEEKQLPCLG